MYYIFLISVLILTAVGFSLIQAVIAKKTIFVFNLTSLLVATCLTFLIHYHHLLS